MKSKLTPSLFVEVATNFVFHYSFTSLTGASRGKVEINQILVLAPYTAVTSSNMKCLSLGPNSNPRDFARPFCSFILESDNINDFLTYLKIKSRTV